MKVADIMERNVQAIQPDALVVDAITTIADAHVTGLPVIDEHGKIIGVISSSDILSAVAECGDAAARERIYSSTEVQELMSRQPRTIEPDASLKDAAEQMLYLDVHRLFVADEERPLGVVSQSDVARAVATSKL